MRTLPRYATLVANYPRSDEKPTRVLLDQIGGAVRASLSNDINTCAVRMSVALNKSGCPVHLSAGVYMLKGKESGNMNRFGVVERPQLFVIRAKEMKTYLESQHGPGKLVYDGLKQNEPSFRFGRQQRYTQGIVVFDWRGPWQGFQAGGHVDLLRLVEDREGGQVHLLPNCQGHCYFLLERAPMRAYFWETRP